MILENRELLLRNWNSEDANRLFELASNDKIGYRCGWCPHQNVQESKMIIDNFFDDNTYAIYLKETGTIVGCISLMFKQNANMELGDDEAELGYWLGEEYWGKGIVCKAAKLLIAYGFEELGLSKIWCGNFSENQQSARVKEKLGFEYQYTIQDKYIKLIDTLKNDEVSVLTKEKWLSL